MQVFNQMILKNWAKRFECAVNVIQQPGTTLLPDEKYADKRTIVLWRIGEQTFAIFDPTLTSLLDDVTAKLPNTALSGEQFKDIVGMDVITSHDLGLLHYLYPPDLPNFAPTQPFSLRPLVASDQEHLSELHKNCTSEEVDDGFVEIDHEMIYGCFHADELVAAASGYRMAGFMDIGVLTHQRFRKMGFGRAAVGALCEGIIAQNIIAQYRCNPENVGSRGLARSLNFRHYFYSETLILA